MPRHSITWKPLFEKQVLIPLQRAYSVAASAAAYTFIVKSSIDDPIRTTLEVLFLVGTGLLLKLYIFPSISGKPKPQRTPALSYEMGINDTTSVLLAATNKTQKAPIQGGDLHSPFIATIEIDRLRVMACRIVYQKYDFGVNTWTSNGGKAGFFKKNTEYLPLRQVLLDHKMLAWKSKTNRGNGVLITDLGTRYFRAVIRDYPPPTPAEFEQKYGIDPMELL